MNQNGPRPLPSDPVVLAAIRPMTTPDLDDVVRLHQAAMGHSLWADLGPRFLRALYSGLLNSIHFRAFVFLDQGHVGGFIAGSDDAPAMMSEVRRQCFWPLLWAALRGLIRRPLLIGRLLQTRSYFRLSSLPGLEHVRAESMFCSFEPHLRGTRVSGVINKVLFDELAARGHQFVKITTEADNEGAVRQLSSWGFEQRGHFRFYGKEMIAWRLDLQGSARVNPAERLVFPPDGSLAGKR